MSTDNTDYGPITGGTEMNTDAYRIRKLEISNAVVGEKVKNLGEKVKNLEDSIDKLTTAVETLNTTMNRTEGGWAVIAKTAGAVAVLVTIAISLLEFIKGG